MNAKDRLDSEVLQSGLSFKDWYWNVYLLSDHWQELRKLKLKQSSYKCSLCDKKKKLDVHHLKYKNIYDVTLIDLLAVCRKCHKSIHDHEKSKLDRPGSKKDWEDHPPNLLPILDKRRVSYQLSEEWSVMTCHGRIWVPKGFVMDGASVPRLLWLLYPPDGLYRSAATVHDWLFANKGKVDIDFASMGVEECNLTLTECNQIFYNVMLESGVPKIQANTMYFGLRLGSWMAWRNSTGVPRIEPLRYKMKARPPKSSE